MTGDRGRVVVVTAATAGVGRATVREFARRGAKIGLIARGLDGLEATAKEVESLGGQPSIQPTDVANPDEVERAAEAVERELGPIEVWINAAMTSVFARFKETEAEEFKRVVEVTFLGQVYGTKAALRRMLPRDRGVIISVGSALAYRAIPLQAAYCSAKHGVQGFMEALRTELMHDGSNVKLAEVHLPGLNTPQFDWVKSKLTKRAQPVPPIYQPEVAARAIAWAAGHPRRQIWVGGSTALTILANRVAPGLLDRYLAKKGVGSQQTDEPERPGRPSNLWEPVPGDWGAHGRFDDRSHGRSRQLWLTTHRKLVAGVALAAAGIALKKSSNGREVE